MRIDTTQSNQAAVWIEPGETLFFALRYLRGRHFGVPLLPPCPFGSPLIRLYHGCYWLGRFRAGAEGSEVRLTGPTVIGNFRAIEVPAGAARFVDCRHVVAFAFCKGGHLRTQLSRLLSPTMWALGHPLPVIVHGPATIIAYGEGLAEELVEPGAEFIPTQIVAFDAGSPFLARALKPDSGSLSQVLNAVGQQARWVFPEATLLLRVPINRPDPGSATVVVQLLVHIIFWALLALMLNL